MINLCRGSSIDCSSSVSQSLAIKDVREQIGVAGEGRSDLTVYRLKCVPVTRQENGSPGQCHGKRLPGGTDPRLGRNWDAQVAGRRGDVENQESRMLLCCSARSSGKAPFSSNHVSQELQLILFPVSTLGTVFHNFGGHQQH